MKNQREIRKEHRTMKTIPSKKITCSLIALIATCAISTAQADLISYDLALLVNTTDGARFNTTMTYPDAYGGGFIVMDPSDNNGRMDRMLYCAFNATTYKIQTYTGNLHAKSNTIGNVGFSGSDVLSTNYAGIAVLWKNSGTIYYPPKDTIFWIGRQKVDEWGNQTAFNDIAYGFKLTDNGAAGADAGDVLQLIGIVYSTGTDSVFGKTADQLTSVIPEPATIGMLGLGMLLVVTLRRLRS